MTVTLGAQASARQSQLQAAIERQQDIRRKLEERADLMSQVRVHFLDPESIRFPDWHRGKVIAPA